jgi:hypothetical protein
MATLTINYCKCKEADANGGGDDPGTAVVTLTVTNGVFVSGSCASCDTELTALLNQHKIQR